MLGLYRQLYQEVLETNEEELELKHGHLSGRHDVVSTQTHAQIRAKDETTTTTTQMTAAATIARGAFSETLKGTVDASGETVAIKRFGESRQAKREMRHEVQVLRALARVASAPFACFTVQLRCVDWDANAVGLELCEGGDLFGLLFQNEELSESDILFYAAEVAAAISHLHANGILHGDIKPENIGITAQGHIRLFDFGLSHIFDQENERDPDTGRLITPTNAGTTMYASPELLMLRQTSMDSDWWSYGVLLFEIFFQRLPWLAESDEDTANLICTEPLVWVHDDKDFASADQDVNTVQAALREQSYIDPLQEHNSSGPSFQDLRKGALAILLAASRLQRSQDNNTNASAHVATDRQRSLAYRVTAKLVHSSVSYARSTIIDMPMSATVASLIQESASLWALDPRQVQAISDGLVISPLTNLGELETLLSQRPGPQAPRLFTLRQFKPLEDLIQPKQSFHFDETTQQQQQQQQQQHRGFKQEAEWQRRRPSAARHAPSKPFFRHLRNPNERADALRDLCLFFAILLLIFLGTTAPISRETRGRPLNDITVRPFAEETTFADIQTSSQIYAWTSTVLREYLLGDALRAPHQSTNMWTINRELGQVLGVLRVRQLRVRANASCTITAKAQAFSSACFANYEQETRAVDSYGANGAVFTSGFEWHSSQSIQSNAKTDIFQDYETPGKLAVYPNSGFLVDIGADFRAKSNRTYQDLIAEWDNIFAKFANSKWIDAHTSAVIFSWTTFVGSAARYETNYVLFEQRLAGQFLPSRILRTFRQDLVFPTGGARIAHVLLGVCMCWLALQKCFHLRRAISGGKRPSRFFDVAQATDIVVLALYIASVALQARVLNTFGDIEKLLWNPPTPFYYPLDSVFCLTAAQRHVLNTLLAFVAWRILLSLRVSEPGSVLLVTIVRTCTSIAATLVLSMPFLVIDAFLVWQLVGTFNIYFRRYASTWVQLSIQVFTAFEYLQPTLLDLLNDRPVIAWYTTILIYVHVLIFRYVFAAIITVCAIHHMLKAIAHHRRAALTMATCVGVDVGTGSVRAMLLQRGGGHILATAEKEIETMRGPSEVHLEQSSEEIWRAVCATVREVLAAAPDGTPAPQAIGFCATCSLVVVDQDGKPLPVGSHGDARRNVILWADHRAQAEADAINATGHPLLQNVGGAVSPEMELPKLLHLQRHMGETFTRAGGFFDLPDYLTFRATGNADTRSFCSLVCKWVYDAVNDEWNRDLLSAVGLESLLDEEQARRLGQKALRPGTPVPGGLCRAAAADMGLPEGLPVGTSLIDAHSGALGMLGIWDHEEGAKPLHERLAVVAGTSNCLLTVSPHPVHVQGIWGPYLHAIAPDMHCNEAGQSAAGALVRHVMESHPAWPDVESRVKASAKHTTAFAYIEATLDELASQAGVPVPLLARHMHMTPDLNGNRSPLARGDLRGVMSGLTLQEPDFKHLAISYLCALQSLCFSSRMICDRLQEGGQTISRVIVCGGLAKSDLFCQMLADVLGMRVALPQCEQAVVLGACMLGAVAAGASMQDVMGENSLGRVYSPQPQLAPFYDAKYTVFVKLTDVAVASQEVMANV
ncbi:FGGY carbohydrate kinase domain-containing protein [Hondaea fermentalgiana]|uniref:FGGY carbohydrate kinase domain-containing protein n=1 Tax=Hondaea fermentalgiana TaxID=2315210 RepID=A0A2R5GN43_9STRA|nr:FGGY carbohydrate kinase domain-containing protein [Hondaea fermentalgiana]|eukprot:GBG32035.1 FGGY carbohydrate kinase domain-containing protein [Hondaea fermentalgiana]